MKSTFSVLGALFAAMFIWAAGYAQAETLQDAVQSMLQSNPEIKSLAYNRLARDEEVIQAKAGYLPTLEFSYSVGFEDNDEPLDEITRPSPGNIGTNRPRHFAGVPQRFAPARASRPCQGKPPDTPADL